MFIKYKISLTYALIVSIVALGFGIAGGLLGLALAIGAPGYYRGVFRAADDPNFNPVEVGVGLGVSQGVICGIITASATLVSLSIIIKLHDHFKLNNTKNKIFKNIQLSKVLLIITFGSLVMLLGFSFGFVVGAIVGQKELYQSMADARIDKIRPILSEHRFKKLIIYNSSDGGIMLSGSVESEQAYDDLEGRLQAIFGNEEAEKIISYVKY